MLLCVQAFQRWRLHKLLCAHNPTSFGVEKPLDQKQQYIFCSFPHGACESVKQSTSQ